MDETCSAFESHQKKWLLKCRSSGGQNRNSFMCLACALSVVEDPNELSVKKKHRLVEVLEALKCTSENVIRKFEQQEIILSVLLSVSCGTDDQLTDIAAECFILFLVQTRNEKVGILTVQRLADLIQEEKNYQQSLLKFQVIGHILEMFSAIRPHVIQNTGEFVYYLSVGLTYPSEAVKSAILFLLKNVYKASDEDEKHAYAIVNPYILKGVLSALKNSSNKEVLANALDLLFELLSNLSTVSEALEPHLENVSFADAAKKVLFSKDLCLQIRMVQCISNILSRCSEDNVFALLETDIPELLFEILGTKNDVLIENIFQCTYYFAEHPRFFTKCHDIYGLEAVIESATHLINRKNWKLSTTALNLLRSLFAGKMNSGSGKGSAFDKAGKLLKRALKISHPTLLLASLDFLSILLRKDSIPWPLPMTEIMSIFSIAMDATMKFLPSNTSELQVKQAEKELISGKAPIEGQITDCGLRVVTCISRLCKEFAENPVSAESVFSCPDLEQYSVVTDMAKIKETSADEKLMLMALTALDDVFIPFILRMRYNSIFGKTACVCLVTCLAEIYEHRWRDNNHLYGLTQKFIQCGLLKKFLEIKGSRIPVLENDCDYQHFQKSCDSAIKYILWSFLQNEESVEASYFETIETGIGLLDDCLENCFAVLSQRCNFEMQCNETGKVSDAQLTLLLLLYISYKHNENSLSVQSLLPHLLNYVQMNAELSVLPEISLKHLSYLIAVCTCKTFTDGKGDCTDIQQASTLLMNALLKTSSFQKVYTHDKMTLWWSFIFDYQNDFTRFVFFEWMRKSVESNGDGELKTFTQLLCYNEFAQKMFLEVLTLNSSEGEVDLMTSCLRLAWENEVSLEGNNALKENFFGFSIQLVEKIPNMLVQHFLTSSVIENSTGLKVPIMLDCLQWCYQHLPEEESNSEIDLKITFYVVKFCLNHSHHQGLMKCFSYLQSVIQRKIYSADHREWFMICGNCEITSLLEKCIFGDSADLRISALDLIAVALDYQIQNEVKTPQVVRISMEDIFTGMTSSQKLHVIALRLINGLIKMDFSKSFLRVVTTGSARNDGDPNTLQLPIEDVRKLFLHLKNDVAMKDQVIHDIAMQTILNLMDYIRRKDPILETYIMHQPWTRIMFLSIPFSTDRNVLRLLEKWISFHEVNNFMVPIIQRFAQTASVSEDVIDVYIRNILGKLCSSPYWKHLPDDIREKLKMIVNSHEKEETETIDEGKILMDKVSKLVQSCLGNDQEGDSCNKRKASGAQQKIKLKTHRKTK